MSENISKTRTESNEEVIEELTKDLKSNLATSETDRLDVSSETPTIQDLPSSSGDAPLPNRTGTTDFNLKW